MEIIYWELKRVDAAGFLNSQSCTFSCILKRQRAEHATGKRLMVKQKDLQGVDVTKLRRYLALTY